MSEKINGLWYGTILQWKMDLRSRSMLVACYLVPLLFFALMGGIFTSVMPQMKETLIPSMFVMGVSMGAFIGLPPSLAELYGSDIRKVYRANGVPLWLGLATAFLSAFVHLMLMCTIILLIAPAAFDAALPANLPIFYGALAIYVAVSLALGSVLGLAVKNQGKLTMAEQILFLPSIMLSGIMFPAGMLPEALQTAGKMFPAAWGYLLMQDGGFNLENLWYLLLVLAVAAAACGVLLRKKG